MTPAEDPERALALSYAPRDRRAALAALLELDATLGQILRTTREPLVGQMRLTWWYAALTALDTAPPPAQPVLRALASDVLPRGVSGTRLARMIDGWEALLAEPLDDAALARHAILRGGELFGAAATVLGTADLRIEALGQGWAYADIASGLSDPGLATLARKRADTGVSQSLRHRRMDGRGRSIGALALIAAMTVAGAGPPGSPRRVARLAWHRLSGR